VRTCEENQLFSQDFAAKSENSGREMEKLGGVS
jgi:hypothetical protein